MVHIHMIYTGFTHFCREISLVAITRFGRHFLAKIGGRRHTNILEDRGVRRKMTKADEGGRGGSLAGPYFG